MKADFQGHPYPLHKVFGEIYPHLVGNTMLDEYRLRVLYEVALAASFLQGDVAEAGVWKGGVVYLLASVYGGAKTVHAFDSWEGLLGLTEEDVSADPARQMGFFKGWGKCDVPTEYLSVFGKNVVMHKGLFSETFSSVADKQFCFVHVDCDLYCAIRESVEFFVPRIVRGGFIIFDDYHDPDEYPGAVKAVDEYFRLCRRSIEYYKWGGPIIRFTDDPL